MSRLWKLWKSRSGTKVTGALLYNMMMLQVFFMFGTIGATSGRERPWQPSFDQDWAAADRFFLMMWGIVEFTTVIFNLFPFYQTFKIIKEGNPKAFIPWAPANGFAKCLKRILFVALFVVYLGGCSYPCTMFMSEEISQDRFFEYVSLANLVGSVIGPILLVFYSILFWGINELNSKFKRAFFLINIVNFYWTAARLARGVHGLINPNLISDLHAEQSTSSLVWNSLIYFFTTIFPYLLLISALIFPSFFLVREPENKEGLLLPPGGIQNQVNDSTQDRQIPNHFV